MENSWKPADLARMRQLLQCVGLVRKADCYPDRLSMGEQQRAAVVRAVINAPELILADEPTANLDAENSHNILRTMLKLNEGLKTCFIFATHDEKVISYLQRIVHLEDGRIAKDMKVRNAGTL